MPSRAPALRRLATFAALAAVVVLGAAASAPSAAAAGPTGPNCLDHPGDTIEMNARWRVFYSARQPRGGEWIDICRRGSAAPEQLLRIEADGCERCSEWGWFDLHGDRLLMQRSRSTAEDGEFWQHQLLDLPTGKVVDIGPEVPEYTDDGDRQDLWALFAPDGAVLAGYAKYTDGQEAIPGTVRAWVADRGGITPRAVPSAAIAASRGGRGRRAGFYFEGGQAVSRMTADGALRTGFRRRANIRRVPNPFRSAPARQTARRLERRPFYYDGYDLNIERRPATGELNLSFLGSERHNRRIRPAGPGWGDVRVIAGSQHSMLLRGHFADDPGRLRVRRTDLLTFSYEGDFDPAQIPTRPGSLAMYGEAVIALVPDGLRIWDGKGAASRRVSVPGAYDLAEGENGVLVTDGTGRPRLVGIREG